MKTLLLSCLPVIFCIYAQETWASGEQETALLGLPHRGFKATATNIFAGAAKIPSSEPKFGYWQTLPWSDRYENFLKALQEAESDERLLEIANLCGKNGMPVCQEYVLRGVLAKRGERWQNDPVYKTALRNWLPLNRERIAKDIYQLPVQQPIFVVVDHTKHHQLKHWAAAAVDIVVRKDGKPYANQGRQLTDHYAWEVPVVAVADGTIGSLENEYPDLAPGSPGGFDAANSVLLVMDNGVIANYAHLKKGSVAVEIGQKVKAGDVLGRIGNSGASGAPHLHFHLTDFSGYGLRGEFNYEIQRSGGWIAHKGEMPEGGTLRPPTAK